MLGCPMLAQLLQVLKSQHMLVEVERVQWASMGSHAEKNWSVGMRTWSGTELVAGKELLKIKEPAVEAD